VPVERSLAIVGQPETTVGPAPAAAPMPSPGMRRDTDECERRPSQYRAWN
jgi:hypothetical protein